MILTCPECATSYFVDDLRVPRGGRMVKCTTCGNRWRAFQDRAEPERPAPEEEMFVEAPRAPPTPPADEAAIVAAPAKRARKPAEKPAKRPVWAYLAGGVAAVLFVTIAALLVFRQQVVGLVPATAPAFAAIGLPVNTIGLVIEELTPKAGLQGGRPVLSVTGSIRNVHKAPVEAPPILISLLDKTDKPVAGLLAQPLNAKVPPGARRYFAVTLADPPVESVMVAVGFEAAPGGHAPPPEKVAVPAAAHGPEPEEAKSLPPDSPDALTKHE